MSFRISFLCLALMSATTTAYGQQNFPQKVPGGSLVFVPDDPGSVAVPLPEQQIQPQGVVPQQHQHPGGCTCQVCARRILSQQTRERSKTIREITTVTVVEETHPMRIINQSQPMPNPCPPVYQPRNPCPPQNPCIPPRGVCNTGGLTPWNQGFVGYRPPQCGHGMPRGGYGYPLQRPQQSINLLGLVTISAGAGVGVGVGGGPAPYAQSGYGYAGNQPWYGR